MCHYDMLGCSPEATLADVKRAYHRKLREFHPDRRHASPTGHGKKMTQALIDAWEVLRDPARRAAYDGARRQKTEPLPQSRVEACRREGNVLYRAARAASKSADDRSGGVFGAALAKFSEGLALAPDDLGLLTNRALCYMALGDWARCRDDARRTTRLKRDHLKGWILLARALAKDSSVAAAKSALAEAFEILPNNPDLLKVHAELAPLFAEEPGSLKRSSSAASGIPTMPHIDRKCKTGDSAPSTPAGQAADKSSAANRGNPPAPESSPSSPNATHWFSKLLPQRGGDASVGSSATSSPAGTGSGHSSRCRSCRRPPDAKAAWVAPLEQDLCTCEFLKVELGCGKGARCSYCLFTARGGKAPHPSRGAASKQGCSRERAAPFLPRWSCAV